MALRELVGGLPEHFPAAVVVLLHWPRAEPLRLTSVEEVSVLPLILAQHGQSLKPATVFLAPPDRHLLITPTGSFYLSQSQPLHFVRPSADLLFGSVAASSGIRAIAVILSGLGSDGSIGVKSVKAAGGIVIAQNQATAAAFSMPKAAIDTGCVDHLPPSSKSHHPHSPRQPRPQPAIGGCVGVRGAETSRRPTNRDPCRRAARHVGRLLLMLGRKNVVAVGPSAAPCGGAGSGRVWELPHE